MSIYLGVYAPGARPAIAAAGWELIWDRTVNLVAEKVGTALDRRHGAHHGQRGEGGVDDSVGVHVVANG